MSRGDSLPISWPRRAVHPAVVAIALLSLVHSRPSIAAPVGAAAARPAAKAADVVLTVDHLRSLSWRSIGPANMGGRIAEIALVPGRPRAAFVGTATGGLFKTTNDGTTWTPVFDDQAVASIGSVVVAPSDSQIVYVGTGEGNGRNSSTWGDGVYKSTDGGGSFTKLGLGDSRDIPRMALHPHDPNIAFAAVMGHLWDANKERGLYRTTDGGKTWEPVLQIDENHGCIDVVIDPRDPNLVYAAMYARRRTPWSFDSGGFGDKGGIFKSTDGGRSFHRLSAGLPARTGRIGLALFAGDPRHVYAVIESDVAGSGSVYGQLSRAGGVFRSLDSGEHWERMNALTPRPFYFSKIVVDPRDEKRLYVLGFGLGVSDDGGKTFAADGAKLPHGDLHSLVIDPNDNDHLWLGTDGGVYESYDRAATWAYHDNLAIGEFYEVSLGMDEPYTICGGLQDNGCWCGPSRGRVSFGEGEGATGKKIMNASNQDWTFIWGGDGYYTAIDPRDPNVRYAESQRGDAGRLDLTTGRIRYLRPGSKEGTPRLRFNWNSPFVLSRHDPDVLYLGGNRLFRVRTKTAAWEAMSPDLSSRDVDKIVTEGSGAETHGTIVTLSESPLQQGLIWAGTDDGRVWVTRDDGKTWSEGTAGLARLVPKGTYVSRLEASHFDPGAALASFDGHRTGDNRPHVMETHDYGRSWTTLTGNLPASGPVRVIREDVESPRLLFAGTEFGAFVSLDRGRQWLALRPDGFPAVQFHDLQIHRRDRDLVAATHGRSIYVLDDITGLEQLTPEVMRKPAVLLTPRPVRGYYMLQRGGMWGNNMYGVKSPPPQATLNYWVRERNRDGAKLAVKDSAGRLVRELEGPAEAGLNRATWDLMRAHDQRYDIPEAENPGLFMFEPAGTYDVELTVGKEKSKTKLVVSYPAGVGSEPVTQPASP
jgi:photosystem II stability/assembly factor-like uncharacterized protein